MAVVERHERSRARAPATGAGGAERRRARSRRPVPARGPRRIARDSSDIRSGAGERTQAKPWLSSADAQLAKTRRSFRRPARRAARRTARWKRSIRKPIPPPGRRPIPGSTARPRGGRAPPGRRRRAPRPSAGPAWRTPDPPARARRRSPPGNVPSPAPTSTKSTRALESLRLAAESPGDRRREGRRHVGRGHEVSPIADARAGRVVALARIVERRFHELPEGERPLADDPVPEAFRKRQAAFDYIFSKCEGAFPLSPREREG